MASAFVDYVKIYFRSGAGGKGVVSFRREKFVDKGGPDGGDGGWGGNIIVEGDSQLWTLLDLKYRKHIIGENGKGGEGGRRKGKDAKDEIIKVPLGTIIKNAETDEEIGEIKKHGEKLTILEGGRGGMGNWHFRSSTHQAPETTVAGGLSKDLTAILELKVLADVGLVGFPNAGKSTLLSVLTAAKPKIANYPFTTLVPNLGIVKMVGFHSFVMADIPGIIEGAHEGKGLGHKFLRHIERNAILLFMIPADSEDPENEYKILLNEIKQYNPDLAKKKRIVAISKSDLFENQKAMDKFRNKLPKNRKVFFVSALADMGLQELTKELWKYVDSTRENSPESAEKEKESWEF